MKKNTFLAFVLAAAVIFNASPVLGSGLDATGVRTTSPGAFTSENPSLDVNLQGTIFAELPTDIISVLMPTQIYFNVFPDDDGWNKVLSPTISVSNLGTKDINLSVTRASATGATLTTMTPTGSQVRLGIAPEDEISQSLLSSTYLLRSGLNDSSYISLGSIGFNTPNNVANYKVYGDAAAGAWTNEDVFTVKTVFKVSL